MDLGKSYITLRLYLRLHKLKKSLIMIKEVERVERVGKRKDSLFKVMVFSKATKMVHYLLSYNPQLFLLNFHIYMIPPLFKQENNYSDYDYSEVNYLFQVLK